MKKLRTLFLIALIWLVVSVSALPATAALDAAVEFLYGPGGQETRSWTPRASTILRGSWMVVAEARASSSLKSFRVAIEALQSEHTIDPGGTVIKTYMAGAISKDRIEIDWDTSKLTRFNGEYRLVATAVSQIDEATVHVQQLKVDNYPQTPTGLVARSSEGVPTLSWKANPEPDILYYRILRSVNAETFTALDETKGVTFDDARAPEGVELRYKVLAVRASSVSAAGISSGSTSPTPPLSIVPASSAGKSQLDEARGLQNPAQASAPTIVARPRDLGYSPYLPYDQTTPENAQSAGEEPLLLDPPEILRRVTEGTAYKPVYTAAGLILFVAALHILRLALQLFGVLGPRSSPPILVSK